MDKSFFWLLWVICILLFLYRLLCFLTASSPPPPPSQLGELATDGVGTASLTPSLTVKAINEYGEYSDAALALYGLEMVVEPHRPTTLTATSSLPGGAGGGDGAVDAPASASTFFVWALVELLDIDDDGTPVEGGRERVVVFEGQAGPQISVELTTPGGVFRLTVEERLGLWGEGDDSGAPGAAAVAVLARATVTVSCKYVRRELRELTDADRSDVLDAMQVYYTVSTEEGKAKYGDDFVNYELLTAYHNADVSFVDRYCCRLPVD